MKKSNDELTQLFRTRLENAEIPVKEGFWEALQQDIPVAVSSRRRNVIYRFSAVASVLLILAGASAALWYFSPKEEIANAFTRVAVSTGTTGKMGVDVVHPELPVIHPSPVSSAPASSKPVAVAADDPDEESFSVSISMSFSFSSSSSSSSSSSLSSSSNINTQNRVTGKQAGNASQATEEPSPAVSIENEKRRTWSVGAFASAGLLNAQVQAMKYKQPFSAGLLVRKELSDRWAIESGLVYTQLNSELTTNETPLSIQKQKLHYLGIPLKANLSLYQNKHVNLYASAGGMIEKCISGSGVAKPTPLQLSLIASAGIEYKLSDRLSLYAEPGVGYHFDDGSPVMTIRKEKPLNVNLLCGVRMSY